MKQLWQRFRWIPATILGSALFSLGFSLFLSPNDMNPGGISGLAMAIAGKVVARELNGSDQEQLID